MNSIFDPIIIIENKNKQAFGTFDGLTKREYIATKLLASLLVNGKDLITTEVSRTLIATDELLKQLSE